MLRLRLRELREKKGISQKQLALALNISQGAIGNWESGTRKPNFEYVKVLAGYFDVTSDYLLGIDEKPTSKMHNFESIESDIFKELSTLTETKKEEVLSYIKFLKTKK